MEFKDYLEIIKYPVVKIQDDFIIIKLLLSFTPLQTNNIVFYKIPLNWQFEHLYSSKPQLKFHKMYITIPTYLWYIKTSTDHKKAKEKQINKFLNYQLFEKILIIYSSMTK